jgi:hypothetical protein
LKQRSWILIALSAAVLICVSAYGLSPYWAFNNLKDAAKSGNRDRLEELVDFSAVRENLKSELAAGLLKSISADPATRENPLAVVGTMLVPAITDRLVDSIVTPDGIALVLSQGEVSKGSGESNSESVAPKGSANLDINLSYRTLNRFRADLRRRDQPDTTLAFTLERRGWYGWKLIRIDIPKSLFDPTRPKATAAATDAASTQTMDGAERAAPSSESALPVSSGSDLCRVVALVRVPSVEDPESVLAPGEIHDSVTQYNVSKRTGTGSFCTHGGYCYPRFISIGGQMTEALRLQNCQIGRKASEDTDETSYSVVLDRSKNSEADLKYNDLTDTLSSIGLCNACADNAARYYLERQKSECGLLVKSALEGDPASKAKLLESPDYCKWED